MKLFSLLIVGFIFNYSLAQTIQEYNYDVNNGFLSSWYNSPGNIIYPVGYNNSSNRTPVIFVHGITGKVTNSYKANIDQVRNYNLKAAFVQLNPLGTPDQNGRLLKRMIDRITSHYGSATVSIVAHSKGGLDTERALYGRNPYNTSIPSFGYEKVDGVYTFSSPLRGSRVADVGASLSWTGIAFIAMWYTNGFYLTSGSVNSFHNWAKSWQINSTSTFYNAYNPNGASYSRLNMIEDNTTRWWAHQSDDPCYNDVWYYCYVGNAFHHSAGAYYDAYWEWDWFNSGWRNWHTSNDGFIAEYRAKRSVITNHNNELTPGAGDFNWRVMQNANHSSLWEINQNHFSNEVGPYLHYGLFGNRAPQANMQIQESRKLLVDNDLRTEAILGSNGIVYFGTDGTTEFIVETDNQTINLVFYTDTPIDNFKLVNNSDKEFELDIIDARFDNFTNTYQSVAYIDNLNKGVYTLVLPSQDFIVMTSYEETPTAFAVNLHFDERNGYNGEEIEVAIANVNDEIDFNQLELTATVNMISEDGENKLPIQKVSSQIYYFQPTSKKGHFTTRLDNLKPGAVYGLQIKAKLTTGEVLLGRNIINTFYVKKSLPVQTIYATNEVNDLPELMDDMIAIYPNPADKTTTLSLDYKVPVKIIIYDTTGNLISEFNMESQTRQIDVSDWKSGVYFVNIKSGDSFMVKKFIVK